MRKKKIPAAGEKETPMHLLAQIYLGLLAVALILWCGAEGYGAISRAKHGCVMLLSGGYVLLSLILWAEWRLTGAARGEFSLRKIGPVRGLIAVYLLLTLAATILSPYEESWRGMSRGEGFRTLLLYGLSFLLLTVWGRFRPWMIHALGGAMSINCLVAVLQLLGYNPLELYPAGLTYYDAGKAYSGEYLGLTGNADVTSALLALVIPLFAGYLWKGGGKKRFWLSLPLTLSVMVLLWSEVAAGYAALLVGLAVVVPVLLPERRQRIAGWCAVGAAAAAAAVTLWLWEPAGGTLRELHLLLHGEISGSFGSGRLHIWKQVLELAGDNLLFGTGPDTLAAAELEGFSRYDASLEMLLVAQIDLAHNEYLNILVSQGLPALLAYLGALGITLARWWKHGRSSPVLAVCGAAILWYSIQVFFSFSLCATAPLFWAVWALAEREYRIGRCRT